MWYNPVVPPARPIDLGLANLKQLNRAAMNPKNTRLAEIAESALRSIQNAAKEQLRIIDALPELENATLARIERYRSAASHDRTLAVIAGLKATMMVCSFGVVELQQEVAKTLELSHIDDQVTLLKELDSKLARSNILQLANVEFRGLLASAILEYQWAPVIKQLHKALCLTQLCAVVERNYNTLSGFLERPTVTIWSREAIKEVLQAATADFVGIWVPFLGTLMTVAKFTDSMGTAEQTFNPSSVSEYERLYAFEDNLNLFQVEKDQVQLTVQVSQAALNKINHDFGEATRLVMEYIDKGAEDKLIQ